MSQVACPNCGETIEARLSMTGIPLALEQGDGPYRIDVDGQAQKTRGELHPLVRDETPYRDHRCQRAQRAQTEGAQSVQPSRNVILGEAVVAGRAERQAEREQQRIDADAEQQRRAAAQEAFRRAADEHRKGHDAGAEAPGAGGAPDRGAVAAHGGADRSAGGAVAPKKGSHGN